MSKLKLTGRLVIDDLNHGDRRFLALEGPGETVFLVNTEDFTKVYESETNKVLDRITSGALKLAGEVKINKEDK
jgi:hypothetical protein